MSRSDTIPAAARPSGETMTAPIFFRDNRSAASDTDVPGATVRTLLSAFDCRIFSTFTAVSSSRSGRSSALPENSASPSAPRPVNPLRVPSHAASGRMHRGRRSRCGRLALGRHPAGALGRSVMRLPLPFRRPMPLTGLALVATLAFAAPAASQNGAEPLQPDGPIALDTDPARDARMENRIDAILGELSGYDGVEVAVRAGVVTLTGETLDAAARARLVRIASRVDGVAAVADRVT